MFTGRLKTLLSQDTHHIHLVPRSSSDLEERFERLRGFNLLPRGARKNVTHLTIGQVVSAILALATPFPGYAAVASSSLQKLVPVGGKGASFHQQDTFGEAISEMLRNASVLEAVREIRLSDSEIYTNAYCRASILYRADGLSKTAHYVSRYAASLTSSGAEARFDPHDLISGAIVETLVFPRMLAPIGEELRYEEQHGLNKVEAPTPVVDLDEEGKKDDRAKRLGLSASSDFLNLGVQGQVLWPRVETPVDIDGHRIILLPATQSNDTSIHLDLHRSKMDIDKARTFLGRFLSILAWCDDAPAVLENGWAGNPQPTAVARSRMGQLDWAPLIWTMPTDDKARRALALYRQGRNAEENFLVSYAVLSYYKIIELSGNKGTTKNWLRDNYNLVNQEAVRKQTVAAFEQLCGAEPPHEYLFKYCRTTVAHAIGKYRPSDPDDTNELRRLHVAADVLRILARIFMKRELGMSETRIVKTTALQRDQKN